LRNIRVTRRAQNLKRSCNSGIVVLVDANSDGIALRSSYEVELRVGSVAIFNVLVIVLNQIGLAGSGSRDLGELSGGGTGLELNHTNRIGWIEQLGGPVLQVQEGVNGLVRLRLGREASSGIRSNLVIVTASARLGVL
jgi:hypothetical protein